MAKHQTKSGYCLSASEHTYQQVLLEPESRKFVTISTPRGFYQYHRLPFGVASAPAVLQQTMERVLQGIPHVVVYIDDILLTRMHNELATKLGSQINTIVCLQFSSAKQTRIGDFFNCSCTISI